MNKKAALLLSAILLLATFLAAIMIGEMRDRYAFSQTEKFFENQTSAYLKETTETERNDLLQENYRVVRNRLSSLRDDGLFSEYSVARDGNVVDQSEHFNDRAADPAYLQTNIAIEFSKGSGNNWGQVRYLTSRKYLRQMSHSLDSSLFLASLGISSIFALAIGLLLWMFWLSGRYLSDHVSALLRGLPSPAGRISRWLWLPLVEVTLEIIENFRKTSRDLEDSRIEAEIGLLAAQVAHDIRSPITALRLAISQRSDEGERVLRLAADRIDAIAEDLLQIRRSKKKKNVSTEISQSVTLLKRQQELDLTEIVAVTANIIAEKRLSARCEIELITQKPAVEIHIAEVDYARILSNLINNSIEALHVNQGRIQIYIHIYKSSVVVSVSDNGKGIAQDVVQRISRSGESFGKNGGNGLGLRHARRTMLQYNGELNLNSKVVDGTIVTLTFPV